ncbi:MAG: hypothetical protein ACXWNR_08510, partial [Candidatus Limnocylindrales bacterium]
GADPTFDSWYRPFVEEMKGDPLMRYFYRLRSEILKEGGLATSSSVFIEYLDSGQMADLMKNPPPGARAFFIGDSLGGSGWEVLLPDGSVEKYYVQLPDEILVRASILLQDPPLEHQSEPIADTSAENLATLYLRYLRSLLTAAKARFSSPT